MSKRSLESEADLDLILTERFDTQELLESVEENIENTTDGDYHYSLDILHADQNSLRIGVYGVEGYELPSQRTVAKAVADKFDWTPAIEQGESTNEHYEMRVEDWDTDSEY